MKWNFQIRPESLLFDPFHRKWTRPSFAVFTVIICTLEPTPEPEPEKPPTPKPPTPPPSPEWESLNNYSHHSWFAPFRQYCTDQGIKVRTFNDFLPVLIEFFNWTTDIVVKHALVTCFDELYHNGVFESPSLLKRLVLGMQQLLSGDGASAKHPIRLMGKFFGNVIYN